MDSPLGSRQMQTLAKLPNNKPKTPKISAQNVAVIVP